MSNIKKALKAIAKQEGTSVAEVKKEIQLAINEAYVTPNSYARCIPSKGDVPTVEEFLEYCVKRIKLLESQK